MPDPKKPAGGRPPKLTPDVRASICRDLAAGVPRKVAATRAGIDYSTFARWVRRGRAGEAGFRQFRDAVRAADAEAVARAVGVIDLAMHERDEVTTKETVKPGGTTERVTTTRRVFDWAAAAWWLERRHPRDWSGDRRLVKDLRRRVAELEALIAGKSAAGDAVERFLAGVLERQQANGKGNGTANGKTH